MEVCTTCLCNLFEPSRPTKALCHISLSFTVEGYGVYSVLWFSKLSIMIGN